MLIKIKGRVREKFFIKITDRVAIKIIKKSKEKASAHYELFPMAQRLLYAE